MKNKREGFPDQRLFRLPDELKKRAEALPLCRRLTVTDTGYFPETSGHRVHRPDGSPTSILLFCVGGRGWIRTRRGTEPMDHGSLVWIPADLAHRYGADTKDPWRLYWIHVTGSGVSDWDPWIGSKKKDITRWRSSEPVALAERFERLWRHQDDGGTDLSLLRMSTEAQALLADAVADRKPEGAKARSLEARVERSVAWMRENLHRPVRLQACARAAGMSASHYSAVFRQTTGVPPLKYFNRLRLRQASAWLDETTWPVQEIADRLGYANPFHFSKAFRQFTGLSPRAYRERLQDP